MDGSVGGRPHFCKSISSFGHWPLARLLDRYHAGSEDVDTFMHEPSGHWQDQHEVAL